MVPSLIRRKLFWLRWRERGLRLVWASALILLVAVMAVAGAFAADWVADLRDEVPAWLRMGLVGWELSITAIAVLVLLLWPGSRRLEDDSLALFVEDKEPQLDHRLISTVQLNRPNADTRGMSPGLIQRLTSDTEEAVRPMSFAALADHRRLAWALLVVVPLVLVTAVVFLVMPATALALLNRQLGANVDIPRRVSLHSVAYDRAGDLHDVTAVLVRPLNDDVELRFAATGMAVPESARGEVKLQHEDGRVQRFPLTFEKDLGGGWGLYKAKVPQPQDDFAYRAWLDDGRTRTISNVHVEPRPTVMELDAVVKLPSAYQLDPDTKPMKDGDVIGLVDGSAQVRIAVQPGKHLESATLEVLERPMPAILPWLRGGFGQPGTPLGFIADVVSEDAALYAVRTVNVPEAAARKDMGPEFVSRQMPLTIGPEGNSASGSFELRPGLTGYKIRVTDQYGFENVDVPRRSVRVVDDELPVVELLPERIGDTREALLRPEAEVEGMPVPVGSQVPIAFRVSDDYGLRQKKGDVEAARLVYRVIKKGLESDEELASQWQTLTLREVVADKDVGEFDLSLGTFENSKGPVEFYAIPAIGPKTWGRLDGGGRFDFQIKGVQNLTAGDRLEFFIEVFDRHPKAFEGRPPGRSEVRVKNVVTAAEFATWVAQTLEQERKLRELEKKQSGVFGKPNTP